MMASALLSAAFGAGVRIRNALYDRGTLRPQSLEGPVVSVGSLSVGGAGKTPFVILLGECLKRRGLDFDILSRGYRRQTRGVALVDPGGLPAQFGDEPLLMARKLAVPVIVGEDRYLTGKFAERQFGPRLHLLDDGFQHRQLTRNFDIVLVTPDDTSDRLLPAGRLREPLSALRRADVVVLTSGATPDKFPLQNKTVWRLRRGIVMKEVPSRPVVFCGIARPAQFLAQLRTAGVEVVAEATFRDHHSYTEGDVRDLLQLRSQSQGDSFITTEKDAVNLGGYFSALEPIRVVPVKMELVDAERAIDHMLEILRGRGKLLREK